MVSINVAGVTLALTVLLALSQTGTCLECYRCSPGKGKCDDPFDATSNEKVTCPDGMDVCLKTSVGDAVTRDCSKAGLCKNCNECKTDLCNSSSSVMPSFLLTSFVGFIIVKYYL